jgi:hypothetical protein
VKMYHSKYFYCACSGLCVLSCVLGCVLVCGSCFGLCFGLCVGLWVLLCVGSNVLCCVKLNNSLRWLKEINLINHAESFFEKKINGIRLQSIQNMF